MDSRAEKLQQLLRDARLWRGDRQAPLRAWATGHSVLDALLPGGGWPCGNLSEIVYAQCGVGELRLATPLLARLTQQQRPVALIAPPYLPYAPALQQQGLNLQYTHIIDATQEQQALWAAEELLRAGAGAVLLWQAQLDLQAQRRLQLAAEQGDGVLLAYRRGQQSAHGTAALSLRIARVAQHAQVEVLKCRGARPAQPCLLAS